MNFNYDDLVNKSYFTEKNFSGKLSPITADKNLIPCANLSNFHYFTSFFLHLYTSLYIELKKIEKDYEYNIIKFSDLINNLKIKINNSTPDTTTSLSSLNSGVFEFTYKVFLNNDNFYTTNYLSYNNNNIEIGKYKPVFGNYRTNLRQHIDLSGSFLNTEIHKNNINNFQYYDNKIKEVIRQILTQTPENIIGFVLYQKIYYNVILYNIDIQNSIRRNYLNSRLDLTTQNLLNPTTNTAATAAAAAITNAATAATNAATAATAATAANASTANINAAAAAAIASTNAAAASALATAVANVYINITDKINDNIENLNKIRDNTFSDKEFIIEKNKYKNKINVFNNLRDEYAKTQDKLNLSIKLYNHELTNYKKIKNYATYIISILIIIIVFTIFLSIFPIFKNDTKNAIYIIIFIILFILTYLYYINFKYIVLYEKFFVSDDLNSNKVIITSSTSLIVYNPNSLNARNNNIFFYNTLLPKINDYSNSVNDLFNDLRINIYTIGNKSFSQDANLIIYNVYLEKKRQLEINNIKLTNLFNMIEIIKKQTSYLFNFVFIIACLCLILLLGLVLYSSVPQLFTFIIILCVSLISILMIYFAFAIIQPTRMIANKNYWAITNPSKNTKGKL